MSFQIDDFVEVATKHGPLIGRKGIVVNIEPNRIASNKPGRVNIIAVRLFETIDRPSKMVRFWSDQLIKLDPYQVIMAQKPTPQVVTSVKPMIAAAFPATLGPNPVTVTPKDAIKQSNRRELKAGDRIEVASKRYAELYGKQGTIISIRDRYGDLEAIVEIEGEKKPHVLFVRCLKRFGVEEFTEPTQIEMPENITTLHEALLFDYQSKQPKYVGQAAQWLKEGKCPHCGELGRYHMSTAICSKHGVY